MKLRLLLFLIVVCPTVNSIGQELSNIGKSPLLDINGGISVNQTWNRSDVPGAYSQPYAYTLVANVNLSVYGWAVPISGMFSNRHWSYQQPFNQFSVNPSYKWLKLYLGYNSMTFSNYTLNGHRFYGGGIEVTPSASWKFSAMAGRMQERILPDSAGRIIPAFYRFGTGFKTEYSFKSGNIALSAFYGRDDAHSLDGYDTLKITPAENLAIGISSNFNLFSRLNVMMEYATSLFTENTWSPRNSQSYKAMPLFPRRTSTRRYNAVKSNLAYNSAIGSIGVGIERVEPGYATLGAYNTVNDFINYTFNYSGQIVPEKVTLATSVGLQKDDLENTKAQKNERWVGNLNIGFIPVKEVNASLTYGNFRNYTHVRSGFENINNTTPYEYADTLDYTQISENVGLSVSIVPSGNENTKHSLLFSVNYQQASEQQSDNPAQAQNRFFNGLVSYNHTRVKQNLNLSTGLNFNRNKADTVITVTLGPTLSGRKMFFDKKMNTSLSLSYNQSLMNSKALSEVYIVRGSAGYTLNERHNFDFSVVFANRHSFTKNERTNDIVVTFTYRYNFKGLSVGNKNKKEVKNGEAGSEKMGPL